eukprot:gb/GFBE01073634.1/.p1 GENE.gb/GFBE01073634.1/~~gb/GFBE01073634.1/.p1  ORF type:complete len:134 (+),score=17.43 gb/GFBE01073634.1/:1-402(+)
MSTMSTQEALVKEPWQESRDRILKQGQRMPKSAGDYMLSHMGLDRHSIQKWRTRDLRGTNFAVASPSRTQPVPAASTAARAATAPAPPQRARSEVVLRKPLADTAPEVAEMRLPSVKAALPPSIFYVGLKFHQ